MTSEKKSTKDDADKGSEKVSKKSSGKSGAKSSAKDSQKIATASEKKDKADKDTKKSSSSKKKHPERSGNPAKAAKALEEESRAAANRVSRTPTKVKDTASPRWYAPTMVTLMVIGLLWVVTTYLFNGNLYIGFLIMMSGFLGLLRWK